jgi:hypothetical protein
VKQPHVTEGLDYWCEPRHCLPCDECDDGCWKCERGLIELSRFEAEEQDGGLVIVHNDECTEDSDLPLLETKPWR